METSYTLLEPTFTKDLAGQLSTTITGGTATFFTSISFIFTLSYVIIIVGAGVMYVRAGVRRMDASPEGIRQSNESMKRVSLGLLGVLSLVLFLMTLNPDLVSGNVGLERLRVEGGKMELGTAVRRDSAQPAVTTTNGSTTQRVGDASYEARVKSHKEIYAELSQHGITTNYNGAPCTEAQFQQSAPRCTSLSYYSKDAVQMLIALKQACKCDVKITGATEPGHAINGSHREGGRGTDLAINGSQNPNDPLISFLQRNGTRGGGTRNCYATYQWNGFRFCDESPLSNASWAPHLHVE